MSQTKTFPRRKEFLRCAASQTQAERFSGGQLLKMFHVEQKEPGAGRRQGTKEKTRQKQNVRLGWLRSLDAFN